MVTSGSLGRRQVVIPRSARRAAFAMGALMAVLLAGREAPAQTKEELQKARQTFMEGVALASGNNCAGAIEKYKEVARVKMTPQVAFNIAECEERLGKLVSALGNYRLVASLLIDPKVRAKAKDVDAQVPGRISALEERIPRLVIKRGKGAEMAVLLLDGAELGSAQIDAELPIDPGPHEVVARVGEKEGSRSAVTVAEKESKTVEVTIDLAALNRKDTPPEPPPKAPEPVRVAAPESGGSKVPGIVVTSIGVASLAAGAVLFFGPRQGTIDELEKKCGGDMTCPPSAEETAKKGRLYTGIAEVAAGVGVVALTTGIVLLATSGGKKEPGEAALAVPGTSGRVRWIGSAPGADTGGVSLAGRF